MFSEGAWSGVNVPARYTLLNHVPSGVGSIRQNQNIKNYRLRSLHSPYQPPRILVCAQNSHLSLLPTCTAPLLIYDELTFAGNVTLKTLYSPCVNQGQVGSPLGLSEDSEFGSAGFEVMNETTAPMYDP